MSSALDLDLRRVRLVLDVMAVMPTQLSCIDHVQRLGSAMLAYSYILSLGADFRFHLLQCFVSLFEDYNIAPSQLKFGVYLLHRL